MQPLALAAPHTEAGYHEVAFRAAPIGLCVLDLDFRYVTVNPCFTRMYGLRDEDFLGRTVEEALPEPAAQIMAHMRLALERDGVVEREIALHDPAAAIGGGAVGEVVFCARRSQFATQTALCSGFPSRCSTSRNASAWTWRCGPAKKTFATRWS